MELKKEQLEQTDETFLTAITILTLSLVQSYTHVNYLTVYANAYYLLHISKS